jgi:hypothetical protein
MTMITRGWMSIPALAAVGAAMIAGYGRADTAQCPNQYVINAAIGMPVPMYSLDQFKSQHPTTGHVMLRGQMAMSGMSGSSAMSGSSPGAMSSSNAMSSSGSMGAMGSSGMGSGGAMGSQDTSLRHLEVYIHSKATGAVVPDATPRITVTDKTAGGTAQDVPFMAMESIGPNGQLVPETVHYGNTVSIPGGHRFITDVTVGCQTASFDLVSPGGTPPAPAAAAGTSPAPAGPSMSMPAPTPRTGVFSDLELPGAFAGIGLGTLLILAPRRRRWRRRGLPTLGS